MSADSNYYSPVDVESFRRKVIEKTGYSLKRNRSPVSAKLKLHAAISSASSTGSATEGHFAIPETKYRSSGVPSQAQLFTVSPGPSSVFHSYFVNQTDSGFLGKNIEIGSQIPKGAIRNEKSARNYSKHITFASSGKSASNGMKQVTFQGIPNYNVGTENYFVGKRIGGKPADSRTPMIKRYWESNIQREEKLKEEGSNIQSKKTFGFPRWRSNDALSASLVASKGNVEIPRDSKIPQHRLEKLEQTERIAQQTKTMIHQSAEVPKKLQKGKSLNSLMMQVDYQPWYDRNQIREAISRESIANLGATKDKFENCASPWNSSRRKETANSPIRLDTSIQQAELKVDQRFSLDSEKEKNGYKLEKEELLDHREEKKGKYRQENQVFNNTHGANEDVFCGHTKQKRGSMEMSALNLTTEQEIFLLFIKQNVDLVGGLGITIPDGIRNILNDLPWKKVELRPVYEEESRRLTADLKSYQAIPYNKDFQNGQVQNSKSGRYVKNLAALNGSGNDRIMPRKTFDMSTKQTPENRRPIMQEVDRERAGDSLIAAEIRMLRDREEELKRSRSELGLPSLEDTIEIWKNGNSKAQQMNSLRSAVSYDYLHQALQQMPKTASIEYFHHISDKQPKIFNERDARVMENDHELHKINSPERNQNRRNQQMNRKFGMDHPLQNGEVIPINREHTPHCNSHFQTLHFNSQYKLHKSDDPDVMIYGPSTRHHSNCIDSPMHPTGSLGTNEDGHTARYE